jgi:glycerophosphoryl diester phosphodiesterase
MDAPTIIAHRTSPAFAPENSLQGIAVSFEQGADGVEIDLRMSLDQRPFLMHDNSMRRTTGWPLPIELTPAAIVREKRLKQGDETVPTLSEAIDALPTDKLFAVDVKTPWSIFALVPAIKRRGMQSGTLVWCSSERVVRYAVRHLPGVEVAYYKDYEDGPNNIEFIGKAGRIGAQAVSLDWRGINNDVVDAAHALGLKVYSWHKEQALTPEKLTSGIDGLITDYPGRSRHEIAAF